MESLFTRLAPGADALDETPIMESKFTVPFNFNHDEQIDNFVKKFACHPTTRCLDKKLTGKHFSRTKDRLVPGGKYVAKFHHVAGIAENDLCIKSMRKKKSLLVGPQGFTLIRELCPDMLLEDKWMAAIEEPDESSFDGRDYLILMIRKSPDGTYHYDFGAVEGQWYNIHYALVVVPDSYLQILACRFLNLFKYFWNRNTMHSQTSRVLFIFVSIFFQTP